MTAIPPHAECADLLAEQMAAMGAEVIVTTEPATSVDEPYTCPHGALYWVAPTPEQAARWAREEAT